jgi:hypothetical protein
MLILKKIHEIIVIHSIDTSEKDNLHKKLEDKQQSKCYKKNFSQKMNY